MNQLSQKIGCKMLAITTMAESFVAVAGAVAVAVVVVVVVAVVVVVVVRCGITPLMKQTPMHTEALICLQLFLGSTKQKKPRSCKRNDGNLPPISRECLLHCPLLARTVNLQSACVAFASFA